MTTPMGSISGPKHVTTTSPVNEKTIKKCKSPFKEKTDRIDIIRNESIETEKDQSSKFKLMNPKQATNSKVMKKIQRNNSERNLFEIRDISANSKGSTPFQFKIPQGLPPSNKRKRDDSSFESPIATLKVSHTESMQRPSKLSEAQRDYDLEQPTFDQLNKKFNTELAKEIFMNIEPKSKTDTLIESEHKIKNIEPPLKFETKPQELSLSVKATLIALMKRETTLEEMCNLLKDLSNNGKLEEFVKELDAVKLEKLWSFESKMLIGRTEIEARNARLTMIFSLLSEGQLKSSLNMLNFVTIIGDTINGSATAAAEGFSDQMLKIIATESTNVEKVHSLGNVVASLKVDNKDKLKSKLDAVSNVHALGIVDSTEKIARKAKLEKFGSSFNLKSMQVSPTSRNTLNNKVKVAVTPQKKTATAQPTDK